MGTSILSITPSLKQNHHNEWRTIYCLFGCWYFWYKLFSIFATSLVMLCRSILRSELWDLCVRISRSIFLALCLWPSGVRSACSGVRLPVRFGVLLIHWKFSSNLGFEKKGRIKNWICNVTPSPKGQITSRKCKFLPKYTPSTVALETFRWPISCIFEQKHTGFPTKWSAEFQW